MTLPRAFRLRLLAAAILGAGCAHAGAAAGRPTGHMTPPVALDLLPYDEFRTPPNFSMEVAIDSLGRPDVSTLRLSGEVTSDARSALERWAGRARFTPAHVGGRAIASIYRTRIKSMLSVTRGG